MSPSRLSIPSPTRASSNSEGLVGTPREKPVTRAPIDWSQRESHAPLKPVCPVRRTLRSAPEGRVDRRRGGLFGSCHQPFSSRSARERRRSSRGTRGGCGRGGCPSPARTRHGGSRRARPSLASERIGSCSQTVRSIRQVVAHGGREDEEPAVGPGSVAAGLLLELADPIAIHVERTEAPGRLDGRDGRLGSLAAVEVDQGGDVDVRQPVAVCEAEVLIAQVGQYPLKAPAGHRRLARLDQGDLPGLRFGAVDLHPAAGQVEADVGRVEVVVGEVLLDQIALVAQADHELLDPVGRIELHDVPEDRFAADLDHRLGAHRGLLAQPRAVSPGQDHRLHGAKVIWGVGLLPPALSARGR